MASLESALKDLLEDQINIVSDVRENIKMPSRAFKFLHFQARLTGGKAKGRDGSWLLN